MLISINRSSSGAAETMQTGMSCHCSRRAGSDSTVLTIAAVSGLRAGCIFSIDGYVANVADGNVVPDVDARNRGVKSAIRSSLDGIVSLARK